MCEERVSRKIRWSFGVRRGHSINYGLANLQVYRDCISCHLYSIRCRAGVPPPAVANHLATFNFHKRATKVPAPGVWLVRSFLFVPRKCLSTSAGRGSPALHFLRPARKRPYSIYIQKLRRDIRINCCQAIPQVYRGCICCQ